MASQNIGVNIEEYLYNKTSTSIPKVDMQMRIEHLRKIGLLEKFYNIYNSRKWNNNTLVNFIRIGSIENPCISIYNVGDEEVVGIKVYYDGQANVIAHKIIIQSVSKSAKKEINDKVSKLKKYFTNFSKTKLEVNSNDSVLIFNFRGEVDPIVIVPRTLFPNDSKTFCNELTSLRSYILLLLGLDSVESDLNTASVSSLQNNLKKKSLIGFKNINVALDLFMKNRKIYGLEESIWQYFTSSNSPLDKYLSVWIYNICMSLNYNIELPVKYLFNRNLLPFIAKLNPDNNILFMYIHYKYNQFMDNNEMSEYYLEKLRKENIDDRLL